MDVTKHRQISYMIDISEIAGTDLQEFTFIWVSSCSRYIRIAKNLVLHVAYAYMLEICMNSYLTSLRCTYTPATCVLTNPQLISHKPIAYKHTSMFF